MKGNADGRPGKRPQQYYVIICKGVNIILKLKVNQRINDSNCHVLIDCLPCVRQKSSFNPQTMPWQKHDRPSTDDETES